LNRDSGMDDTLCARDILAPYYVEKRYVCANLIYRTVSIPLARPDERSSIYRRKTYSNLSSLQDI
jgi:hypothetical protein